MMVKDMPRQILNDPQTIIQYLGKLPPALLGVDSTAAIEILDMTPGSYNLNYHVKVDKKEFIFRINIEQQSGLLNQVEYEFRILNFLAGRGIAPRAFHFDAGRDCFNFDILIEEFLQGPPLSQEQIDLSKVAGLLARLHALNPAGMHFVTWQDPLAETYELARNDLVDYQSKKTGNNKTINLARQLLAEAAPVVADRSSLYKADSLNHTDVAFDNFIMTPEGLRLIDWEKPRADDRSYDLCCFLSEPAQLWCSPVVLDSDEKTSFLQNYARLSGHDLDLILEKVRIREPLVSLHWILWGAAKLCDLNERRTAPELVQAHAAKIIRYERIADPANIEKLLDIFQP
jgi:thiamine kinase-like enzyme